jgi:hypothetical protein
MNAFETSRASCRFQSFLRLQSFMLAVSGAFDLLRSV